MTEPVRPLEALIADIKHLPRYWMKIPNAGQSQTQVICVVDLQRILDELAALLQAAATPAPTADVIKFLRNRARLHYIKGGLEYEIRASECDALADGFEEELAEAAPPERVSEGKRPVLRDPDGIVEPREEPR
jgi:hypothetical protein